MFYNNNIVFLHIQKTSGTTFSARLAPRYKLNKTKTIDHDRLIDQGKEWIKDRKTYSFLRNPYDWYKSYYSFLKPRLNHKNPILQFIKKEWSPIDFTSIDTFIESMTSGRCVNFRISPFLQKREGDPYIDYDYLCKKYSNLGMYSITFLDFIRLEEDLLPINKDHVFFNPKEFYEHHKVVARLNKSNSHELQISNKSKDLIDKYDMPTFSMLLDQLSEDYDIF